MAKVLKDAPMKPRQAAKKRLKAGGVKSGKTRKAKADSRANIPKSIPKPVGRPRLFTPEDQAQKQRDWANNYRKNQSVKGREIGKIDTSMIDWGRRKAAMASLRSSCEIYMPRIFSKAWSDDQLECIERAEIVVLNGGCFCLAMPRAGGKTAICRGTILWATANGFRRFPFLVGSAQPKAEQSLKTIKTYWYSSPLLLQDYPEIAYPVHKIENRWHLATGQTHNGLPTHIEWGTDTIRYPSLLLSPEEAEPYLANLGEEFCKWLPEYEAYWLKNMGAIFRTSGIDGSIRGDAEIDPITLEQPRPDMILLDDVQKDQKAESPTSCEKMELLIDGAIQGLAGPGESIACLMPCTVIREGDVADRYLDPDIKPDFQGKRCALVKQWPNGITDFEITLDTEEGRLWNDYGDVRKQSLRLYRDIRLATDFYQKNREVMDRNFVVGWKERYDAKKAGELSAQQHAMNLRYKNPLTFPAEFQNRGRRLIIEGIFMMTARKLSEKVIENLREFHVPAEVQHLVCHIDVQDELFYYLFLAVAPDFTGVIPHYGVWPHVGVRAFTKHQSQGWGMLTTEFFNAYPEQRDKAIRTDSGRLRAPLEPKIYHGLTGILRHVKSLNFVKDDGFDTPIELKKIGVDTRWGQTSDVVKQFCQRCRHKEIVPYRGEYISPANRQYEEYTRERGWLFEDQVNPQVKEVKWVWKPQQTGQYILSVDADRMKDYAHQRLASPLGQPGSIALYDAPPEFHESLSHHICDSEYPEPVIARAVKKNKWKERDGRPDNDWFDCFTGCLALASMCGAYLRSDASNFQAPPPRQQRKLSSLWQEKHKRA